MNARVAIAVYLLTIGLGNCDPAPQARRPADLPLPLTRLFGPVLSHQVIAGREEEPGLVMLLVERAIVRVDLRAQRASSTAIQVDVGERCWGLARVADGSLWTLKGRNALARIASDGRVVGAMTLSEPHAGLFAVGDRLVYQKAVSTAPEPALRAAAPGGEPIAWSDLRVRSFPGLDRAQASALSLVACGLSRVPERACWFPDEAAVAIISPDGHTRRLVLPGLTAVAPEVLLTANNPRRPIRDAYVDDQRRIWVLSSGEPATGSVDPGGWMLARYGADGTPDGQARFAEPVRLILRVDGHRVIVLAGSGYVSELASW